jgi:catalase
MPSAVTDSLKIGPGPKGFAANFVYEISKHGCYERETDGLVQQVAFQVCR